MNTDKRLQRERETDKRTSGIKKKKKVLVQVTESKF